MGELYNGQIELGSEVVNFRSIPIIKVKCSTCENVLTVPSRRHLPPSVVAKIAMSKGWSVVGEGREATCPACLERARLERRERKLSGKKSEPEVVVLHQHKPTETSMSEPTKTQDQVPVEATATEPEPEPKTASVIPPKTLLTLDNSKAREAKREAIALMMEFFDVDGGKYQTGYSDTTIGSKVGLSQQAVATIRETFFGPIKTTAEIEALKRKIAEHDAHFREEIDSLRKLIGALEATEHERRSALVAELAVITASM